MSFETWSWLVVASLSSVAGCSAAVSSTDGQTASATEATQAVTTSLVDAGQRRPDHREGPPGPPPEAVAACESKAVNEACTVSIHGESLTGTCRSAPPGAPGGEMVACHPDNAPGPRGPRGHHPPPGRPPVEVFAACEGKAVDAGCRVTLGEHTLEGSCRPAPPGASETRLACAPRGPRPEPPTN